ncbi:MAG: DUF5711 family protein [Roseburia sp.]|nr:DUF5711 family protein [Roseburia sp.]
MAEIKNYLKEKEQRERNQTNYKDKIRRHKLTTVYRMLLVAAVIFAFFLLIRTQYRRHLYTDYDIVGTVSREKAADAVDMRLQNAILTYSKDGAHCTNMKGTVTWNQTYEISDILLSACQDVVAIGDYNGRNIYVQSAEKQLGEITTNLPIKDITVSAAGTVTAILEDTDITWINTYSATGKSLYDGQAHMSEGGYPCAISLSPNGELLAVSYLYIEAGALKTNVAFYNFGAVGANQSDYLVSTFAYENLLVPEICFMNNDTAFAVGDGQFMIYKGAQKPDLETLRFLEQEIQAVYYNEKYIGLVFPSDNADAYYKLVVYNTTGNPVTDCYFDIDYRNIFFTQDNFVIYNETECLIMTMDGVCKYQGHFDKPVNLMLPAASGRYRYVLVTDNSIDTIQLK